MSNDTNTEVNIGFRRDEIETMFKVIGFCIGATLVVIIALHVTWPVLDNVLTIHWFK